MSTDPPVSQRDGAVVIRTTPMLAAAYRAVLVGIARRRADGLPSGDLQQLARALRRAHIDAMSQPRQPLADSIPVGPCSNSHDSAYVDSAAAAELLGLSRRSVQRLAGNGLDGVRVGSIWLLDRDAVMALAREREARQ